jgi:hypothetical protein
MTEPETPKKWTEKGLPADPQGPVSHRKRRISQPRQRGVRKVKLNFNVPEQMRKKLEMAAQRHDSSLSDLLTGAVERCLKDDVWNPRARNAVSRNRTIVPPEELVDISNQLLTLGFLLEQLIKTPTDHKLVEEAARIHLDARLHLAKLREDHGC